MSGATNTEIVQQTFASFLRGDVESVVNALADDVEWHAVYGAASYVPTGGLRRGKAQVQKFFSDLAAAISFDAFEPREYIAQGDKVAVLGHYRGTARPTGRPVQSDWVMVFTLRDGKVTRFREYTDSAAVNAAYRQDK